MNECRPLHPRESFDLLLVDLIVVAGVALALMGDAPSGLVRTVVMVPLVLLLPGYALTAAVDPEWRFDVPERLVLTLGGSLVVATLGGLVLNWTAWGLQAGSWAALLAGTTLSASALALRRRQRVRPADPMQWCRSLELRQVLLAALAVLATAAALQIARVG
ncbi:MAG: DUF1616 domain-containing protein, partial [Chloroflexi bacterium]|nr:DUF1616 domain-containing protein [Chloroflexota bacterium]